MKLLENYVRNRMHIEVADKFGKTSATIRKMKEDNALVDLALETLDPLGKLILECYYKKGMSYRQIAKENGYAKSTIFNKALKALCEVEKLL